MDPISALVAVWLVVLFLTTRTPKLLMESRDGDVSEAYAQRLKRIEQAGVAAASGSPLRRYVGNAWRDFLLDREAKRRAAVADEEPSWWSRRAGQVFDRWRRRNAADDEQRRRPADEPSGGDDRDQDDSDPKSPDFDGELDDDDLRAPVVEGDDEPHNPNGGGGGGPWGPDATPWPWDDNEPWPGDEPAVTQPATEATPSSPPGDEFLDPPQADEPIRVPNTAGEPIPNTLDDPHFDTTQGEPDMTSAVANGTEVTGVVSGAMEARSIQRQVNEITAAYVAALNRLGIRITNLGVQAQSNVQLRQNSAVVNAITQAGESCAAARGYARGNASEVEGALQIVANAFARLNS